MPEVFPKITIVTASYNQGPYIEDCIRSVVEQEYPNLEYIIIDGGSTDSTNDIIRKYEKYVAFYVSEKDHGLYDALNKGFQRSSGEIMGWLNSDDILHRKSLFTIAQLFTKFSQVKWLQGYPTVIDDQGKIVHHRSPRNDKFDFLQKKYHDGIFIQQESTCWHRSLWEKTGSRLVTSLKYAGDFELWMRFFEHEPLFTTDALIGAFRVRGAGQLSSDHFAAYLTECDAVTDEAIQQLSAEDLTLLKTMVSQEGRKYSLLSGLRKPKPAVNRKGKNIAYDFAGRTFTMNA